jgi:hypothetical protein
MASENIEVFPAWLVAVAVMKSARAGPEPVTPWKVNRATPARFVLTLISPRKFCPLPGTPDWLANTSI